MVKECFTYAFEFPDRTDPDKRIMRLTKREFEMLLTPSEKRKALASLEFQWNDGERIRRIPNQQESS